MKILLAEIPFATINNSARRVRHIITSCTGKYCPVASNKRVAGFYLGDKFRLSELQQARITGSFAKTEGQSPASRPTSDER
jgi:hypothetical protein